MNEITQIRTLADLLEFLKPLTATQLAQPIEIGAPDEGLPDATVTAACIAGEDTVWKDGDWDTAISHYEALDLSDADEYEVVFPKGRIHFASRIKKYT